MRKIVITFNILIGILGSCFFFLYWLPMTIGQFTYDHYNSIFLNWSEGEVVQNGVLWFDGFIIVVIGAMALFFICLLGYAIHTDLTPKAENKIKEMKTQVNYRRESKRLEKEKIKNQDGQLSRS